MLALGGFLISFYIYEKNKKSEKLICFIGNDCDRVIKSEYSTILLGIPNEILGMFYYGIVVLFETVILLGVVSFSGFQLIATLFVISAGAAFYSVILTFIQVFIIKEYCEYCFLSSAISISIFVFALF